MDNTRAWLWETREAIAQGGKIKNIFLEKDKAGNDYFRKNLATFRGRFRKKGPSRSKIGSKIRTTWPRITTKLLFLWHEVSKGDSRKKKRTCKGEECRGVKKGPRTLLGPQTMASSNQREWTVNAEKKAQEKGGPKGAHVTICM